jgi:hypothetical protein
MEARANSNSAQRSACSNVSLASRRVLSASLSRTPSSSVPSGHDRFASRLSVPGVQGFQLKTAREKLRGYVLHVSMNLRTARGQTPRDVANGKELLSDLYLLVVDVDVPPIVHPV